MSCRFLMASVTVVTPGPRSFSLNKLYWSFSMENAIYEFPSTVLAFNSTQSPFTFTQPTLFTLCPEDRASVTRVDTGKGLTPAYAPPVLTAIYGGAASIAALFTSSPRRQPESTQSTTAHFQPVFFAAQSPSGGGFTISGSPDSRHFVGPVSETDIPVYVRRSFSVTPPIAVAVHLGSVVAPS